MAELIDLGPKAPEASSILRIDDAELLRGYGFDRGFWVCIDESRGEQSLALLGHAPDDAPHEGWRVERIDAGAAPDEKTEDAEALTRDERGYVYVFGSQYGSKAGPLQPRRAFIGRFHEPGFTATETPTVELFRRPFLLHRKINDALRSSGIALLPLGPNMQSRYIAKTMREGARKDATWRELLRFEDWPINLEGATYVGDDVFLLGLRFPTTADGHPLIVRVRGLGRWADAGGNDDAALEVELAAVLTGLGDRAYPVGVRDMTTHDGRLHVLAGAIGTERKPSAIEIDYAGYRRVDCVHVQTAMPGATGVAELQSETVHAFEGHPNIEGLEFDGRSEWVYVLDEDERLRLIVVGPEDSVG